MVMTEQVGRMSLLDTKFVRLQVLQAHTTVDNLARVFAEERAGLIGPMDAFDAIKDYISRMNAIQAVLINVRNVTLLAAINAKDATRGRHAA